MNVSVLLGKGGTGTLKAHMGWETAGAFVFKDMGIFCTMRTILPLAQPTRAILRGYLPLRNEPPHVLTITSKEER